MMSHRRARPWLAAPLLFASFAFPAHPQDATTDSAPALSGAPAASNPPAAAPVGSVLSTAPQAMTPHPGRSGPLTEREMAMARAAWSYFVVATQEQTGLANAVKSYPSTTMWDTASYISAMVAAREFGIIDKREFDLRVLKLLGTLRKLELFRGELPNKVYQTETAAKVNYTNEPGEVGYSALDVGRLLIWFRILKQRYPYLANSVDGVMLRWNYCKVVDERGQLFGTGIGPNGETQYLQEGRLGYEEYAAKGFALWGFDTRRALQAGPFAYTDIFGVRMPYDARDPRRFGAQNYVLAEAYLLEGIELNWDLADDRTSPTDLFTDGWRAEFATRVYLAQERRWEKTGIVTARTEHQLESDPFFVYDTVFSDGYPWNVLSPSGVYAPDRAAVAVKGALGMWALWPTPYTDLLFETVAELYDTDGGFYEGVYENGSGYIPVQTANNNGIILASLLYKVEGPLLRKEDPPGVEVWYAQGADFDTRRRQCLPEAPLKVECPVAQACGEAAPAPTLALTEYDYCEPVAASEWYAGCAFAHPEPAARDCKPGEARRIAAPAPPPAPGSLCPVPANAGAAATPPG